MERTGIDTNVNELITALVKAKMLFKTPKMSGQNPYWKSGYSTYNDILEACQEGLLKNGLAIVHITEPMEESRIKVNTRLYHTSGQYIESVWESEPYLTKNREEDDKEGEKKKPRSVAQVKGSEFSYGRRYTLMGLLGVAGEEEDDAEATARKPREKKFEEPKKEEKPLKTNEDKPKDHTYLEVVDLAYKLGIGEQELNDPMLVKFFEDKQVEVKDKLETSGPVVLNIMYDYLGERKLSDSPYLKACIAIYVAKTGWKTVENFNFLNWAKVGIKSLDEITCQEGLEILAKLRSKSEKTGAAIELPANPASEKF